MTALRRAMRLRWRRDDGAVAIEFALVLPILVVLVFGIIQFGLFFNRQQGVHAAAREGARIAALSSTTSDDVVSRVDDALSGISLPDGRTITISAPAPYGTRVFEQGASADTARPCQENLGLSVTVTVTASMDFELPPIMTRDVTVTGTGDFRCESD
ncbi:MAG: TadE/TadG family type IV pilus assembly protein [Acidimicrobiales bacterium]